MNPSPINITEILQNSLLDMQAIYGKLIRATRRSFSNALYKDFKDWAESRILTVLATGLLCQDFVVITIK